MYLFIQPLLALVSYCMTSVLKVASKILVEDQRRKSEGPKGGLPPADPLVPLGRLLRSVTQHSHFEPAGQSLVTWPSSVVRESVNFHFGWRILNYISRPSYLVEGKMGVMSGDQQPVRRWQAAAGFKSREAACCSIEESSGSW